VKPTGFLVLESGEVFPGLWRGGAPSAGEVVFNTSHSGYEEMATDPSYMSQILVLTAPMQGNYGESDECWESDRVWIHGFVCLELQNTRREASWRDKLDRYKVPILTDVDTRSLVLRLRSQGVAWGALVPASGAEEARAKAAELIRDKKILENDWVYLATTKVKLDVKGFADRGPRVALLDLGSKRNILRELRARCSEVRVFPSRSSAEEILDWKPDGILLSNGPGDPSQVEGAAETVRALLGKKFIFGICMGHQILGLALGGKTYKLKFGHRGSNHPVQDLILDRIYMTSQNHGYAVEESTLPEGVKVTHTNLNDGTVSGIYWPEKKCLSVQFHPESHPGPHEASELFDYFIRQIQ
jgi:carbamoyl-phosphate synthase small subunit